MIRTTARCTSPSRYVNQQQGDWDMAFDEYSSSKESEPDFAEVHNRLALVFYHGDDGDNTIAEARTALSMDFQDAEAYRMLGLGHYANEEYPAALNAFQESLTRDPGNADVYYEMGMAEQETDQQTMQAVADFRKALQLNPQLWQAHSSLGSLLAQQSHFAEAIAELNTAKQLAPNEPSIRENLANAYYGKGDYDVAIAEYNELFKTNPGWRRGHDSLARAYMAKNEYESAICRTEAGGGAKSKQSGRTPRAGTIASYCPASSRKRSANCELPWSLIRTLRLRITTWAPPCCNCSSFLRR